MSDNILVWFWPLVLPIMLLALSTVCILIVWFSLKELSGGKHQTVEDAKPQPVPKRRHKTISPIVLSFMSTPSGHFPWCVFAKESSSLAKCSPLWPFLCRGKCENVLLLWLVTFLLLTPELDIFLCVYSVFQNVLVMKCDIDKWACLTHKSNQGHEHGEITWCCCCVRGGMKTHTL